MGSPLNRVLHSLYPFTSDTHSDGTENYPPQPYKYKFEYKKSGAGSYSSLRAYDDSKKYKYNTKIFMQEIMC